MAYNVPSFLKKEGDSLLYNSKGEMYIYLPEVYFDNEIAMEFGSSISTIGIGSFSINNNPEKPNLLNDKNIHNLNFPSIFVTTPYKIESVKNLAIRGASPLDYRILIYKKDDVVVQSCHVPKIVDNIEEFYKLVVIIAKLPHTIKYGTIWRYFIKNAILNGANYKINASMFGIIESELCRDPDDYKKNYAQSKHYKDGNRNMYSLISVKELPRHISAYTAITSENWDESIIAACSDDSEIYTPLEKILMS